MTATANRTADRGGQGVPAPAAGPLALLPRRRRWGLFALGVVLVALGAVVAYLLVVTAGVTRPYLAVARDVPYGATIGAADLAVVSVNPAAGLSPIPASERDRVIGKHAAADLFAGTLLTRAHLTDTAIPAPGEQLVGVELKPGQLPARALRPGDAVILVVVAPGNLAAVPDTQPGGATKPSTIRATVAGTAPPQANGNVRVDVVVSRSDGPTVASMAAAGRIVVVMTTRE
jgi:SAF domain